MKMKKIFILMGLLLALSSCQNELLNNNTLKSGWDKKYDVYIEDYIKERGTNLLEYNNDMNYWKTFFYALARAESNLKPTSIYWEKNLGVSCLSVWSEENCNKYINDWNKNQQNRKRFASKDKRGWDNQTKSFYLSEGLLQLSYSDKRYYGCDFDWKKDKFKLSRDSSKTIFDPKKNLECGIIILDRLVKRKGKVFFNKGHYWSVLKPNNRRHKYFQKYFKSK